MNVNFYSSRNTNCNQQDLLQQLRLVLKSLVRPMPYVKAFWLEHAARLHERPSFPHGCRLPHLQAAKERKEGHGATIQAIDVFGQAEDRGGARPGGFAPRDSANDLARRLHHVSRGERVDWRPFLGHFSQRLRPAFRNSTGLMYPGLECIRSLLCHHT